VHHADNILGRLPALPLSKLAGGRTRLVVIGIDNMRTIPNGPGIGKVDEAHVGLGEQPAAFHGDVKVLDNGRRGIAYGTDHGGTPQQPTVLQAYPLGGNACHACLQAQGDLRLFHLGPSTGAQGGGSLGSTCSRE
jgi:hypothetical protein